MIRCAKICKDLRQDEDRVLLQGLAMWSSLKNMKSVVLIEHWGQKLDSSKLKSEWEKIEGRVGTTPLEPSKNFRALCLNVKVAERVYVMK